MQTLMTLAGSLEDRAYAKARRQTRPVLSDASMSVLAYANKLAKTFLECRDIELLREIEQPPLVVPRRQVAIH